MAVGLHKVAVGLHRETARVRRVAVSVHKETARVCKVVVRLSRVAAKAVGQPRQQVPVVVVIQVVVVPAVERVLWKAARCGWCQIWWR